MTGLLDREFGKYRLLKRLGRGGMADVFLARDTEHGRDVALKVVEVRDDRDSREICDAERRGAHLQDQFSRVDSRVPLVHAWGTRDGWFFIDMEYVDGEDLAERAGRSPLTVEETVWVGVEICAFLERAHRFEAAIDDTRVRGIIHGDIKPKNVRLNREGQLKVLDFGIAKGLSLTRKLTRNDFGSVSYMSPERLDSGDVDVHTDLWSVGVLLYELATGRVPFEAETTPRLEALIRSRQPAPPLPPECPPGLTRIILKALAGDLRRRYQDAGEIREDLEAFRAGLETRADREWLGIEPVDDRTRRTTPAGEASEAGDAGETRRTPDDDSTVRTAGGAAAGALEDAEATRRTGPVADVDATRRTGPTPFALGEGQPGSILAPPGHEPPPLPEPTAWHPCPAAWARGSRCGGRWGAAGGWRSLSCCSRRSASCSTRSACGRPRSSCAWRSPPPSRATCTSSGIATRSCRRGACCASAWSACAARSATGS